MQDDSTLKLSDLYVRPATSDGLKPCPLQAIRSYWTELDSNNGIRAGFNSYSKFQLHSQILVTARFQQLIKNECFNCVGI